MPTLILSPRYTPDSNTLWQVALQQGWQVERLHSYTPPEALRDQQVAIYGEGMFVQHVAEVLNLRLHEAPLDWLATLPYQLVQRSVQVLTLAAARERSAPMFVKPAELKSFAAKVYAIGAELPDTDTYSPDLPVLVSEPVTWRLEFRCFVLHGEVKTLSPYSQQGNFIDAEQSQFAAETAAALQFAREVLQTVDVPPAFVLDVGQIQDRGWAVVEANPAWAAGIYRCEPAAVLEILAASVEKITPPPSPSP